MQPDPRRWNFTGLAVEPSGLSGWFCTLWELARNANAKTIVEIGLERGQSGRFLADAAQRNGGRLWSIDPVVPAEFHQWRSRFVDTWTALAKTSDEAILEWTLPIDLLLIDGDHAREQVQRDWDNWSGFVKQYVLFHDTEPPYEDEVRPVVEGIDRSEWNVSFLAGWHGLAICQRIPKSR